MSDVPPREPAVGPLAQEAAQLLDVVADRLSSMKPGAGGGPGDSTADGAAATAHGRCPECGAQADASCTACPLCRLLAVLRGERPEATAKLVDGALLIVRTLRSLIGEQADLSETPRPPTPARQDQPPGRRGGLEHIDIL
jgi:hypothetical protein